MSFLNSKTSKKPTCFQCGSELIEVSRVTSHPEGSLFPQTTAVYRCSNVECQDQKDKDEAKRLKAQAEKEKADKKRDADKKQLREDKIIEAISKGLLKK